MLWRIALVRAGLAGFVWGMIVGLVFGLHEVFAASPNDVSRGAIVAICGGLLSGLFFWTPVGLILAIPLVAILEKWEAKYSLNAPSFLRASILSAALCGIPLALCYANADCYYGPSSGFTGSARVALVAWLASLMAGYVVGRELPQSRSDGDKPAWRNYQRFKGLLAVAYASGMFFVFSAVLTGAFP